MKIISANDSQTTWQVSAPANLALIKYMGKRQFAMGNLPANASLSLALPRFEVTVTLTLTEQDDHWVQPVPSGVDAAGQQRFLAHLHWLKQQTNCAHHFAIQSTLDFPIGCGLASSAASFAALTRCFFVAMAVLAPAQALPTIAEQASLSRQGSGSSCRSFFSPWAYWQDQQVEALDLPFGNVQHCAVVVDKSCKAVSSSQAHQRVQQSLLYVGRPERAEQRLSKLLDCLHAQDWGAAHALIWAEFWDMHALFETAGFGYLTPDSLAVLRAVQDFWQRHSDGPWCTVDAGANIHLLYRPEQADLIMPWLAGFKTQYEVY